MDNNQDKSTNLDNYDLILEDKEKELKKEKRNKRILASSLLLLLLLGSTAVVTPIISVAVNNKNNSANNNENKIPNTLSFSNTDIDRLINGYKSEIQDKKLSFEQFQNDFINITKKHIVASNIKIGSLVLESTTIKKDVQTNNLEISIVLDNNNRNYLTSEELIKAKLNENTLSISFKQADNILTDNDFFTPIDINKIDLSKLKDIVQNKINADKLVNNETSIGTLKDIIINHLGISKDLIQDIKYEEPQLIIIPKEPHTFVSDTNSDLIVNGNIVLSDIKFYKVIKLTNLETVYNAVNTIINSKNKHYNPDQFRIYLNNNQNEIKKLIFDNLIIQSPEHYSSDNILNIFLDENDDLIINLKDLNANYLKYETEYNINFSLQYSTQLVITNLNFYYPSNFSTIDCNLFDAQIKINNTIYNIPEFLFNLSEAGKFKSKLILPKLISNKQDAWVFNTTFFWGSNAKVIDMSAIDKFVGRYLTENNDTSCRPYAISDIMFGQLYNIERIILPKTTQHIGAWTFYECYKLGSIKLPKGLKSIGDEAFNSSGIKSLDIPESVDTLGANIFRNCTRLAWIRIPSKITNINPDTFLQFNRTIYVPTIELKKYYESLNLKGSFKIIVGEPPAL
ncbi:MAG: leucine-rich repeat domain-containing protein [Ureaplasma sp.]|nr:leucine-rich repeat domain-containing protein [Ureaplasma sp.]